MLPHSSVLLFHTQGPQKESRIYRGFMRGDRYGFNKLFRASCEINYLSLQTRKDSIHIGEGLGVGLKSPKDSCVHVC